MTCSFFIYRCQDIREELTFQSIFDSLVEKDFFDHELKELEVYMKQQILEVLLAFISFLHAYDRKKRHNKLILMFNPRFKSMRLITIFLARENDVVIVAKYNQQLLLPLLTKTTKMLMPASVEEIEDFQSQGNVEDLFQTSSTKCRHSQGPCVKRTYWIFLISS